MEVKWSGWETVGTLGSGSFGKVYEIQRVEDGKTVKAALKIISVPASVEELREIEDSGLTQSEAELDLYLESILDELAQEVRTMKALKDNKNIVRYDGHRIESHQGWKGSDILIKMELLQPLKSCISLEYPDEKDVIKVGMDICQALISCHSHNPPIIHRDIKQSNIMVDDAGNFKLGDFGVARTLQGSSAKTRVGTEDYMAPEVILQKSGYGASADIYSLGIVLYKMLNNNRIPFLPPNGTVTPMMLDDAKIRRTFEKNVPPPARGSDALKRVILKAIEHDPRNRFHTAQRFYEALKSCSEGKDPFIGIVENEIDEGGTITIIDKDNRRYPAEAGSSPRQYRGEPGFDPRGYNARPGYGNHPNEGRPGFNPHQYDNGARYGQNHYADGSGNVPHYGDDRQRLAQQPNNGINAGSRNINSGKSYNSGNKNNIWIIAAGVVAALAIAAGAILFFTQKKTNVNVQWLDYDGTVLMTDMISDGITPEYNGPLPVRTEDSDYTYKFDYWDKREDTGSKWTYVAVYSKTKKENLVNAQIGDTIKYGSYEGEAIDWMVIDKQGDRMLVISKYALDNQQYNSTYENTTWETCDLRTWLTGSFFESAFDENEQNRIVETAVTPDANTKHKSSPGGVTYDRVFILSSQEVSRYLNTKDKSICRLVKYKNSSGSDGLCNWWVRTPGESNLTAVIVDTNGTINYSGAIVNDMVTAVRPAMWIYTNQ